MVLSGEILVLLLQDGVVLLMGWDPVGCRGVWSRKLFSRNPINQHGTTQLARWNTFSTRPDILQQNWRLLTKKWKKLPTHNCGTEREKRRRLTVFLLNRTTAIQPKWVQDLNFQRCDMFGADPVIISIITDEHFSLQAPRPWILITVGRKFGRRERRGGLVITTNPTSHQSLQN